MRSAQPNRLVIGIDQYAAEIELAGGDAWQEITLAAADFKDASETALPDWGGIRELRLAAEETLRVNRDGDELTRVVGAEWNGAAPRFRNLRWETDPAGGAAGRIAAR